MTHSEVVFAVSNWFKMKPEVEIVTRFSFNFPMPDIQVQFSDGSIVLWNVNQVAQTEENT